MRPNFFVNTPDILHAFLQYGGPAGVQDPRGARRDAARPTWGVYAGYELYEHVAVQPGSEEYLDSEKYQLRPRDWDAAERDGPHPGAVPDAGSTRPARPPGAAAAAQPASFHSSDDDAISSTASDRRHGDDDVVIVVVNLDPHARATTTVHLDMPALGLDWDDGFTVRDELTGETYAVGRRQLRAASTRSSSPPTS